jgi:hypothetical protein
VAAVAVATVQVQAQGLVRERGRVAGIVLEAERLPGEMGWVRRGMIRSQRPYRVASLLHHHVRRRHREPLRPRSQQPSEQRFLPQ